MPAFAGITELGCAQSRGELHYRAFDFILAEGGVAQNKTALAARMHGIARQRRRHESRGFCPAGGFGIGHVRQCETRKDMHAGGLRLDLGYA